MAKAGWKRNPHFRRQLSDVVRAVPREAEKEFTASLKKTGDEAVQIIKGDTPIDDGPLRASVNWSFGDPPAGVLGAGDTRSQNTAIPNHMRISIFAGGRKAPHAHIVHNGTGERVRKDGRSTGVARPQPFFWPNIRSLRRRIRARLSRAGSKGLKKAVR